jgi:arylsulfatase A-like enzyme
MRMPFLMRYPRAIPAGTVNDGLYANVDIAPTLLELAGVAVPRTMQGKSMKSLLNAEATEDGRKSQFYTYWGAPPHYGIRTERYTYLHLKDRPAELFDRQADPEQLHNVARDPANKGLITRLEEELQRQIQEVDIPPEDLPGFAARGARRD